MKEGLVSVGPQNLSELLANFPFSPRQADHVVLDQHPAAEIHAMQIHATLGLDNLQSFSLQYLPLSPRGRGSLKRSETRRGDNCSDRLCSSQKLTSIHSAHSS